MTTSSRDAADRGPRHTWERLVDEHSALRRVAMLIARQCPAPAVFAAVAEEVGRVLRVEDTRIVRYGPDGTITVVATWGKVADGIPVGTRWTATGENISTVVLRTGKPARQDHYDAASGPIGAHLARAGIRSAVGAPIVVEGRVWGAMIANSVTADPLPAETETQISRFTALVATAISNLEAREELAASRIRLAAAGVEERRQVVRDLHDGAQQRLVHTVAALKLAQRALERGDASAPALLAEAIDHAERANQELRELAHGILPSALTRGGLSAAMDALADRSPVPVELRVGAPRLPPAIEATAYFVVSEALTNVAKHAHARRAEVTAHVVDGTLRLDVRDDGVGGARRDGQGLIGLADRLAALGGRLRIESPPGAGTLLAAEIPV
jgi:signal transduction histidine kinase